MRGFNSLKNYSEFKRVYDAKKSFSNKYLIMYVAENNTGEKRLGISVSKKVGNSIVRHRITRLIRESYRLNKNLFLKGYDVIFIARPAANEKGYREIESAMLHLMKLHGFIESY